MSKFDDDSPIDPRIEYLGNLEFNGWFLDDLNNDDTPEDQEEARAFLAELRQLSEAELDRRYREEYEREEKNAQDERKRECEHWASAPFWKLEEAAALISNQMPTIEPIEDHPLVIPDLRTKTAKEEQAWNLAKRHRDWGSKSVRIDPGEFLDWARVNGFVCPPELEEAVRANGHRRVDWRQRYKDLEGELKKRDERIDQFGEEKLELTRRIETLENDAGQTLGTRERETLLKIIVGMAIRGYSFDPNRERNNATTDILDDLAVLGLTLDPKTLRKKLSDACELIDQDVLADLS